MTPAVLEASSSTAPAQAARPAPRAPSSDALPRDAILSLEQAAELLGETLRGVRDLTSVRLLKHQLIDGERCVWLSDLLTYKRDFERAQAEYRADPLSRLPDDLPNPIDVLPEYAHMRRV